MKLVKFFFIILTACTFINSSLHAQYKLTLKLEQVDKKDTIIIQKKTDNKYILLDSFFIDAGKKNEKTYNFSSPSFIAVRIVNKAAYKQLIVDSLVEIRFNYKGDQKILVTNSRQTDDLEKIQQQIVAPVRTKIFEINKQSRQLNPKTDSAAIAALLNQQTIILEELAEEQKQYIYQNPGTLASLDLISWGYSTYGPVEVKKMIHSLSEDIQLNELSIFLLNKADEELMVSTGQSIPVFNITDARGKKFTSEYFKNKLVLLDFWGTWCGPCLRALPELVSLQKEFKNKGLLLVSYAKEFTNNPKKFAEFEKKHNITWLSFYELDTKPTGLLKLFKIDGFPTGLLIYNGIIKKRFIGGNLQALNDYLKENY